METRRITTLEELTTIAEEVLTMCTEAREHLITLEGDLGAGKTAFTKALASLLGVEQEITSPTFVVMRSYEIPAHDIFKTLVHLDAYRIESDEEMRVVHFDQVLSDTTQLVCVEWPEKIEGVLPAHRYAVHIVLNDNGTRDITYGIKN